MTCQVCGRYSAPCPFTGYDADDLCPECQAADDALEALARAGELEEEHVENIVRPTDEDQS